jgi:hypothetical protein
MFYQVTRPVPFPCFGVFHKEKHVLLHSVADVVVEQGAIFAILFCIIQIHNDPSITNSYILQFAYLIRVDNNKLK